MFQLFLKNLEIINLIAWILMAATSLLLYSKIFKGAVQGWKYVFLGSLFVVARQVIKLIPAYNTMDSVYMSRYLVGIAGAIILFIGFLKLYQDAKA